MKITVEIPGKEPVVFSEVSDAYLAVRQLEPMGSRDSGGLSFLWGVRSFSWGASLRPLVEHLAQSLVELQEELALRRAARRKEEAEKAEAIRKSNTHGPG